MDSITFEKLKDIEARFAEVEARMSDADVARDPSAYQKLARESREIAPIVDRYRSYKAALAELTKVQEMIRSESDPEMREMAHEELRALEARRDALDAEIPLLLIPKDPKRREERADGAGIGAIVDGKKGALIGGLIGAAGGTVYDRTTRHKDVYE